MKLLALTMVVLGCTYLWADKWTYFFPESVLRFGCVVTPVTVEQGRDANEAHPAYTAEAWAERSANLGRWEMSLDYFEATPKGRRKALKACAAFMDEAEKRVAAAAPIRVKPKETK